MTDATPAGAAGADTVAGAAGGDTTAGAAGADTVKGAAGADTVAGAAGNDTAAGAAGADTYDLKAPEGVEFDTEAVAKLVDWAKANNVKPEQAQQLADMAGGVVQKALEASAQAWRDQQVAWVEAAKKDPELGGAKFADNLKTIDVALAKVGTPELAAFLKETGLNANTEIARLLFRVGKAISEDSFKFGGNAAPGADLPPELVLFPSMRAQ